MGTVKVMLANKNHTVWSINHSQPVLDAVKLMAEKEVGALTVLDDNNDVIGIVSERDFARKIILADRSAADTAIEEIMTSDVISANEDSSVEQCMALMNHHKIRHLPVLEARKLVGIITVADVLKAIVEEQAETIDELESVIYADEGGEG